MSNYPTLRGLCKLMPASMQNNLRISIISSLPSRQTPSIPLRRSSTTAALAFVRRSLYTRRELRIYWSARWIDLNRIVVCQPLAPKQQYWLLHSTDSNISSVCFVTVSTHQTTSNDHYMDCAQLIAKNLWIFLTTNSRSS